MSNIYIQEPPSSGKVLLRTSVGDIDIELWTRECPKTCRNFIQLCMEGYYNGTVFHRVVKGFIVQGGDPNGDGTGGESIYGNPFKDEFHSRLRYARRGLVGMANSGKDDNGSQFFFTMAQTPELQNKHTLFGKVTGDTLFNMLKLEDGLVDQNERPMYPQRIIRAEILNNPFDDIVPRVAIKEEKKDKNKIRRKGVKNFGLLSFGEEAEEDEEESNQFVQKSVGKAKSLHDVVDDPKLSKEAIKVEPLEQPSDEENMKAESDVESNLEKEVVKEERLEKIKNKLKEKKTRTEKLDKSELTINPEDSDSEADVLLTQEQEKRTKSEKRKEEIRQEILTLKKQYQSDKKTKDELLEQKIIKETPDSLSKTAADNELIKKFIEEKEKYGNLKAKLPKKGVGRENFTLNLLSKFRTKLDTLRQKQNDSEQSSSEPLDDSVIEREIQGDDWLAHTLKFEEKQTVLAKDASTKDDDWYDAYDPRNPLNKRKRGDNRTSSKEKSSKRLK